MRRRGLFVIASLLVVAACGERMIFEASTDPTIAGSAETATTTPATDDTEAPVDVNRPAGTISWSV
ncbi:MAG: hypothetical protein EBS71_08290, partial [Actinobacteria bacterium]|nr:hypothetical protein [Actinomycetota bacterium]